MPSSRKDYPFDTQEFIKHSLEHQHRIQAFLDEPPVSAWKIALAALATAILVNAVYAATFYYIIHS